MFACVIIHAKQVWYRIRQCVGRVGFGSLEQSVFRGRFDEDIDFISYASSFVVFVSGSGVLDTVENCDGDSWYHCHLGRCPSHCRVGLRLFEAKVAFWEHCGRGFVLCYPHSRSVRRSQSSSTSCSIYVECGE